MIRGSIMRRYGLPARAGAGLAVLLALIALPGCLGGTGTDTENGIVITTRVVDGSGDPVAGLEMQVSHTRTSSDSLVESPLVNPGLLLVTDNAGIVIIQLKRPGIYIAQGRRGDTIMLLDTLRALVDPVTGVLLSGLGNPVYTAGTPVRASGRLRLLSGFKADSGRVYLRGTSQFSNLGADGSYDLGWVTSAAEKMAITVVYASKPAETRFVKIASHGGGLSVLTTGTGDRCLSDSAAVAAPVDTVDGSITYTWDVARLVGKACSGREGALVRAYRADAAGNVIASLGNFVVPASDAPPRADSSALHVACLSPSRTPTDRVTLRLLAGEIAGEIVVDDLVRGLGCLQ
jgi:hypothetical protein